MRILFCLVLLLYEFYQSLTTIGMYFGRHSSKLISVSKERNNITAQFGILTEYYSNPNDSDICYGTHGEKAKAAKDSFERGDGFPDNSNTSMPRCHSEFYLLKAILNKNISLRNCDIVISNSGLKPCIMAYGQTIANHTEYNPGIPCDTYLKNFAKQHNCRIHVNYPGGSKDYQ